MSSLKYQIGVQAFLPFNIGPAHIRMDVFNEDTSVVKVEYNHLWRLSDHTHSTSV